METWPRIGWLFVFSVFCESRRRWNYLKILSHKAPEETHRQEQPRCDWHTIRLGNDLGENCGLSPKVTGLRNSVPAGETNASDHKWWYLTIKDSGKKNRSRGVCLYNMHWDLSNYWKGHGYGIQQLIIYIYTYIMLFSHIQLYIYYIVYYIYTIHIRIETPCDTNRPAAVFKGTSFIRWRRTLQARRSIGRERWERPSADYDWGCLKMFKKIGEHVHQPWNSSVLNVIIVWNWWYPNWCLC